LKYADDTSLIVPQNSSVTLETEFAHLLNWSLKNILKLNTSKTKEIALVYPDTLSPLYYLILSK